MIKGVNFALAMAHYQVLLYYYFRPLSEEQIAQVIEEQRRFCQKYDLRGRVLVAFEGINGTLSGKAPATAAYMYWMQHHPLFQGIEFKVDAIKEHVFPKLKVKRRKEIVNFAQVISPVKEGRRGKYIEPSELLHLYETGAIKDYLILDARSVYETTLGKFQDAVAFPIQTFRELPKYIEELKKKYGTDKKVITYCTGGIKCEKVSLLLEKAGFKEVYQLHGGIVRYAKEAQGKYFEGRCYVFDNRVAVSIRRDERLISNCIHCNRPSGWMINCANADCNRQFVICQDCAEKWQGCCSEACLKAPKRRKWNKKGLYLRGVDSKNYVVSCS